MSFLPEDPNRRLAMLQALQNVGGLLTQWSGLDPIRQPSVYEMAAYNQELDRGRAEMANQARMPEVDGGYDPTTDITWNTGRMQPQGLLAEPAAEPFPASQGLLAPEPGGGLLDNFTPQQRAVFQATTDPADRLEILREQAFAEPAGPSSSMGKFYQDYARGYIPEPMYQAEVARMQGQPDRITPYSSLGKLQADRNAGLISDAQYEAEVARLQREPSGQAPADLKMAEAFLKHGVAPDMATALRMATQQVTRDPNSAYFSLVGTFGRNAYTAEQQQEAARLAADLVREVYPEWRGPQGQQTPAAPVEAESQGFLDRLFNPRTEAEAAPGESGYGGVTIPIPPVTSDVGSLAAELNALPDAEKETRLRRLLAEDAETFNALMRFLEEQ